VSEIFLDTKPPLWKFPSKASTPERGSNRIKRRSSLQFRRENKQPTSILNTNTNMKKFIITALLMAATTTTALQGQETLFGVPLKEGAPVKAQAPAAKNVPGKKTISRGVNVPLSSLPEKYSQFKMDLNSAEKQKMAKRIAGKYWKSEHEDISYVFYPSGNFIEVIGTTKTTGKWHLIGGDTVQLCHSHSISYALDLFTLYDNDTVGVRVFHPDNSTRARVFTVIKK
jgi:hypothetical protein